MLKEVIKNIIKKLPVSFTLNQRYDVQTREIISKVCMPYSNTIDIGCHKGEVLDMILKYAPKGSHYGFEPIPELYQALKINYPSCHISPIALSNKEGESSFNYVVSNPAYSGLIKRQYDRKNEVDQRITVQTARLDTIIPTSVQIDFIKIDVEGGELLVLEGAIKTISRCTPYIIFEHGIGASEFYDSTPEKVFELLSSCGLKISTMKNWLDGKKELSVAEFKEQFHKKLNYYFIAYGEN